MKNLLSIILLALTLASCEQEPFGKSYTTLLLDLTPERSHFELPDTASLWQMVIPSNGGVIFELAYLTDLHNNSRERLELPPSGFLDNKLAVKSNQRTFLNKAIALIHSARKNEKGREQSIILSQIANTLNRQANCKTCTERYLYLVSDLMEYSGYLNFYDVSTLAFFEKNQDSLHTLLDQSFPLDNNLDQTVLAVIHQPLDRLEDQRFHRVLNLLTPYYKAKGIYMEVFVSLEQALQYINKP